MAASRIKYILALLCIVFYSCSSSNKGNILNNIDELDFNIISCFGNDFYELNIKTEEVIENIAGLLPHGANYVGQLSGNIYFEKLNKNSIEIWNINIESRNKKLVGVIDSNNRYWITLKGNKIYFHKKDLLEVYTVDSIKGLEMYKAFPIKGFILNAILLEDNSLYYVDGINNSKGNSFIRVSEEGFKSVLSSNVINFYFQDETFYVTTFDNRFFEFNIYSNQMLNFDKELMSKKNSQFGKPHIMKVNQDKIFFVIHGMGLGSTPEHLIGVFNKNTHSISDLFKVHGVFKSFHLN